MSTIELRPVPGFPEYEISVCGQVVIRNLPSGQKQALRHYTHPFPEHCPQDPAGNPIPSLKLWNGNRHCGALALKIDPDRKSGLLTIPEIVQMAWGRSIDISNRNEEIRARAEEGVSKTKIAEEFGISRQMVYKILNDG